jgi:uncharacterized protein YkwD
MESGTLPAIPAPEAPTTTTMLRALAISVAMLAVGLAHCAAQTTPRAVATRSEVPCDPSPDVSAEQPNPGSNLAAGSCSGEDSAAENELLQAANKSRELAGVPPLRMEQSLREAARAHARRMVENERLDHQFSGEPSLMQRIALVTPLGGPFEGSLKIDRAGENLVYAGHAPEANQVLMRSAPHRENLLNRGFNIAGIAAIWSQGRLYVVQDFAHEVPSYSAEQTGKLVGRSVEEMRQQAGLPELIQRTPPKLDEAACSLARENLPNAHLLAAAYANRRIITYTQSHPEILPQAALPLLRDPGARQFAVGACYARNAVYPAGTYWVAILLY